MSAPRHFLDLSGIARDELHGIIGRGIERKRQRMGTSRGRLDDDKPLDGMILATIFEYPSTRTRVSFDVAMRELGGSAITLQGDEIKLGERESIADTARVLSRYVDGIMIRIGDHAKLEELAEYATVPVINGLTNQSHPCQVMADVMTMQEHLNGIAGKVVAWSGDGNNMVTSWIHAAAQFDFEFRIACPDGLGPDERALAFAAEHKASVHVGNDPVAAVQDADCVVTDTWVSLGETAENRHNLLKPFQVNETLMSHAKPDAIFMHCLPAYRDKEVTEGVIDGPQSVVFDEAENRVHAQKEILTWCLG